MKEPQCCRKNVFLSIFLHFTFALLGSALNFVKLALLVFLRGVIPVILSKNRVRNRTKNCTTKHVNILTWICKKCINEQGIKIKVGGVDGVRSYWNEFKNDAVKATILRHKEVNAALLWKHHMTIKRTYVGKWMMNFKKIVRQPNLSKVEIDGLQAFYFCYNFKVSLIWLVNILAHVARGI